MEDCPRVPLKDDKLGRGSVLLGFSGSSLLDKVGLESSHRPS